MARQKVTVVGAGSVGATTAQRLFERGYMDVVLIDVVEDMPQGKALDIAESGPILGVDATITGSNGYEESANSDVVVITAGIARKPGMSRDDLLFTNMKIVGSVVREVAPHSPNSTIIVISNPLDAMVQHAYSIASGMGFTKNRVLGMAGVLDTGRFRTFLAQELNVSVRDVQAYVLGGHGDQMVPLTEYTTVGGVPISKLLSARGAGAHHQAHPGRRRRDRCAAQDRQRVLRAVSRGCGDGRRGAARPEAVAPLRRAAGGRVRHQRRLYGRARHPGRGRCREGRRAGTDPAMKRRCSTTPPTLSANSSMSWQTHLPSNRCAQTTMGKTRLSGPFQWMERFFAPTDKEL